jgi:hypothetical protein
MQLSRSGNEIHQMITSSYYWQNVKLKLPKGTTSRRLIRLKTDTLPLLGAAPQLPTIALTANRLILGDVFWGLRGSLSQRAPSREILG